MQKNSNFAYFLYKYSVKRKMKPVKSNASDFSCKFSSSFYTFASKMIKTLKLNARLSLVKKKSFKRFRTRICFHVCFYTISAPNDKVKAVICDSFHFLKFLKWFFFYWFIFSCLKIVGGVFIWSLILSYISLKNQIYFGFYLCLSQQ